MNTQGVDAMSRAALLVGKAIVPAGDDFEVRHFRILPDPADLDAESAERRLGELTKPVVCSVASAGSTLVIDCRAPSPVQLQELEKSAGIEKTHGAVGERGRREMVRTGLYHVLLRGRGETMVMTAEELEEFKRQFFFADTHLEAGGPPRDPGALPEVGWAVEYKPLPPGTEKM